MCVYRFSGKHCCDCVLGIGFSEKCGQRKWATFRGPQGQIRRRPRSAEVASAGVEWKWEDSRDWEGGVPGCGQPILPRRQRGENMQKWKAKPRLACGSERLPIALVSQ